MKQDDDERQKASSKPFKCSICNEPTTRMTPGGAVCTRHFIEGWGRLPEKPLPQAAQFLPLAPEPLNVVKKHPGGRPKKVRK